MSMAHDWRPCTWRVNDKLEAWMLLGRVFEMVCSMDVNINLFFFVLPAVLLCFEAFAAGCTTFVCLTAGTAACWAAGLRKGLLPAHMAGKWQTGNMDASWPSIWYGLFNGCQHLFVSFSPAVLVCLEAFAASCETFVSLTAGTATCWAAGLRKGLLPATSLWGHRASVRLPASEISCPREVEVLVCHISIMFRRCSMPRPMFETAWNSGNLGIFRWLDDIRCYILVKSVI